MTLLLDAILALVALEAAYLGLRGRYVLLPNVLSGAALMLALRLALGGAGPLGLLLCLGVSGLAHLADLRLRLRCD